MSLKVSLTSVFILAIFSLQAQEDAHWDHVLQEIGLKSTDTEPVHQASIIFEESPQLQEYLSAMDSLDRKQFTVSGYRIQIYSGSGPSAKKAALDAQSDFLKYYAKFPSYTQFSTPNWVLRVGDFRTRLEALEFHNEIRAKYPASFIIRDEIRALKK